MFKTLKLASIAFFLVLISCTNNTKPSVPVSEEKATKPESVIKKEEIKPNHHHYICFNNDENAARKIWIGYSEDGKAQELKNKGRIGTLTLKFVKEEIEEGKAKTIQYYNEIYENIVNGQYKLTHSGNWDYVEYTRGSDGKKYNYTIDHDANPYGKEPCF